MFVRLFLIPKWTGLDKVRITLKYKYMDSFTINLY